jgi:hypothetical protein
MRVSELLQELDEGKDADVKAESAEKPEQDD